MLGAVAPPAAHLPHAVYCRCCFLTTPLLHNQQEHVTCAADMLVSPDNTAELAAAIKDARARAQQQGRPLKMRPARRGFATMASFACAHQPTLTTPFRVKGQEPFVVG